LAYHFREVLLIPQERGESHRETLLEPEEIAQGMNDLRPFRKGMEPNETGKFPKNQATQSLVRLRQVNSVNGGTSVINHVFL
jgi:hypothetical protein